MQVMITWRRVLLAVRRSRCDSLSLSLVAESSLVQLECTMHFIVPFLKVTLHCITFSEHISRASVSLHIYSSLVKHIKVVPYLIISHMSS